MYNLIGYLEDGLVFYRDYTGYYDIEDTLVKHYNDLDKIKQLIALGNIKELDSCIDKTVIQNTSSELPYVNTIEDYVSNACDLLLDNIYLFNEHWLIYNIYETLPHFRRVK